MPWNLLIAVLALALFVLFGWVLARLFDRPLWTDTRNCRTPWLASETSREQVAARSAEGMIGDVRAVCGWG